VDAGDKRAGIVWTAGDAEAVALAVAGSEIEKLSNGCVVVVVMAAAEAGAGTV
jgi:hypothetical protein